MDVFGFAKVLTKALQNKPIEGPIENEKEFEKKFVIPVAKKLAAKEKQIFLFVHPWGNKTKCKPDCDSAPHGKRQIGCPVCWKESKKRWASLEAFGTQHTFDLMVMDDKKQTLAMEVKIVGKSKSGRLPSGEIQRFFGQCALAATKHDLVIGFCAVRGSLKADFEKDTNKVRAWAKKLNIILSLRGI